MSGMSGKLSSSVNSATSNPAFQNDRRRRDNMNERIQELLQLIPSDLFQDYYSKSASNESSAASGMGPDTPGELTAAQKLKGTGTRDGKPNKGQILTQAVEFITKLQNDVDTRNREEVDLMTKVQRLNKKTGTIVNDINLENTSAEVELSKIGVGPLAGAYAGNDNIKSVAEQPTNEQSQQTQYDYGGYAEYANGV